MKKSAWIFAVIIAASGASSANARGAYLCSNWQEFGTIKAKVKRKCRSAHNSFDAYWEVCRPGYNGWQCNRAGPFEPQF